MKLSWLGSYTCFDIFCEIFCLLILKCLFPLALSQTLGVEETYHRNLPIDFCCL